MNADFSQEYRTWVNTESITLESVRVHGTLRALIGTSRRSAVNIREQAPSFGAYQGADCGFRIPSRFVPAEFLPLKPRDRIIDEKGAVYTVLSVQPSRNNAADTGSWKLLCRDLSIAFDLRDLISIEEPRRELDEGRAKLVRSWEEKYRMIPARVQLESEAIAEMAAKRVTQGTYRVFVDREVQVTHENRIRWIPGLRRDPVTHILAAPDLADIRYLEVVGYHNAENISELPVIDCRSTP